MDQRLNKLFEELKGDGTEAMLLSQSENIRYFSGYTGEGYAFVAPNSRVILTDSRYTEQAHKQAPGFDVAETRLDNTFDILAGIVRASSAKAVAFEDDGMPVAAYRKFSEALPGLKFVPAGGVGAKVRSIKDNEEFALYRKAGQMTDKALEYALSIAKPGMTEVGFSAEVKYFIAKTYNAQPAFEFIIASGENGSMPHATASERVFRKGDMVTLDFGIDYLGYKTDMTRTFALGEPSAKMKEIYAIVQEAQRRAGAAIKAGVLCRDVDAAARSYITECGYGANFGHGLGHGVGLQIHEQPTLNAKSTAVLTPGMAFTNEPGIYLSGVGGVRIEDTCILTETGWESIFASGKDLIIL